jgi:hypothetical protein
MGSSYNKLTEDEKTQTCFIDILPGVLALLERALQLLTGMCLKDSGKGKSSILPGIRTLRSEFGCLL